MRFIFCLVLYHFIMFGVGFDFFPISIRSLFSVIGLILLFRDRKYIVLPRKDKKLWVNLVVSLVLLLLIATLTAFINSTFDSFFFKFPVQVLLSFLSNYVLVFIMGKLIKKQITVDLIKKFYVYACLFECFMALMFFIFPSIRYMVYSHLSLSALAVRALEWRLDSTVRLIGLGARAFLGGIGLAIGIFLASTLINKSNKSNVVFLFLVMIIISVVGSLIVRTTLVGMLLSVVYIILRQDIKLKNKIYVVSIMALLFIGAINLYTMFFENSTMMGDAFHRAFSLFYNYEGNGEFSDLQSYSDTSVYPKTYKTWVIGDGLMADPYNPETAYYRNVDIGYARTIWGIGIIGLVVYVLVNYYIIRLTKFPFLELLLLLGAFFIIMFKGICQFSNFLGPFIVLPIYSSIIQKKRIKLKTK